MDIAENIRSLKKEIPAHVRMVAVSKTRSNEEIMKAYEAGQRVFGENKAQELIQKAPELPDDIEWHFIGHLQRNKVKYLLPYVSMIEAVDSLKLLKEINKQAGKINTKVNCLLQFHIATEDTKFGLDIDEAKQLLNSETFGEMHHIVICGVMGMATYTDNERIIREEFGRLRNYFNTLKTDYFSGDDRFCEISMGMSSDFQLAIEEGSTNVRIGTAIFGPRQTPNLND